MRLSLSLFVLLLATGPSFGQSVPSYDTNGRCNHLAGDRAALRTCVTAAETVRGAAAGSRRTDLLDDLFEEARKARLRAGDDVAVGLCPPLHRMTRNGCL